MQNRKQMHPFKCGLSGKNLCSLSFKKSVWNTLLLPVLSWVYLISNYKWKFSKSKACLQMRTLEENNNKEMVMTIVILFI